MVCRIYILSHHIMLVRLNTLSDDVCVCPLQLNGERNYHIFYRMLAGMTASDLAKLHLVNNPRKYDYLTKVRIHSPYTTNV